MSDVLRPTIDLNAALNQVRAAQYEGRWFANERVTCADGFSVSIQANELTYCTPREDYADVANYDAFELGFPSERDELLMQWCSDPDEPTSTVYPQVPREIVQLLIEKHGGILCEMRQPSSGALPGPE